MSRVPLLFCRCTFNLWYPSGAGRALTHPLQWHLDFTSGLTLLWRFVPEPCFTKRCINSQGFDAPSLAMAIVALYVGPSPRRTRALVAVQRALVRPLAAACSLNDWLRFAVLFRACGLWVLATLLFVRI